MSTTPTTTTPTPTPLLIPRSPTPPLSPPLHTALQTALLTPSTIRTLRQTLDSSTRAHSWQANVKQRTLQLLASKEYWKYEDLVGVIVREARGVEGEGEGDGDGGGEERRGEEGQGKEAVRDGGGKGRVDIRIPERAVTEAAVVVKGVLGAKVELEADGKGFWD